MGYIMKKYGRENFVFLDNFIRMTVPYITKDREGKPVATVQVADPTVQVKAQAGANPTSTPQVTPQVRLSVPSQVNGLVLRLLTALGRREKSVAQLLLIIHIKNRKDFRERYLNPALEQGLIEMSQPDSPRSPTQKYRLTAKGMAALQTA